MSCNTSKRCVFVDRYNFVAFDLNSQITLFTFYGLVVVSNWFQANSARKFYYHHCEQISSYKKIMRVRTERMREFVE